MPMRDVRIILASASPRRKELLEKIGLNFDVIPADVAEERIAGESPAHLVMRLSELKGQSLAAKYPQALIIASDTAVSLDAKIYGKPHDGAEAFAMLSSLSGQEHTVYTGLALFWKKRRLSRYDCTRVQFRELTASVIESYVVTGEPFGKAGGYAIQGVGSLFARTIRGDYSTVVGFPVCLFGSMMEELGFSLNQLWEVSS